MPAVNQKLPAFQGRVCQRPPAVRSVLVRAGSSGSGKPKGVQSYLTDAVQSVVQTERAADLQWKGSSFEEMAETFKQYVVGMLSKAANSKDVDAVEPEWKRNEFEGRIQHKHNDRH